MKTQWHNPTTNHELVERKLRELASSGRRPVVQSYGGGLDSWDLTMRSVEAGCAPDFAVFVDVGNPDNRDIPGEWPSTLRHLSEVVRPYCDRHGIAFVVVDSAAGYPVRPGAGEAASLFEWMWHRNAIPVSNKAQKLCTQQAKIERFDAWLAEHFEGGSVEVWIGFNASEEYRISAEAAVFRTRTVEKRHRFPLIEWGVCRCRSVANAEASGYPVPRKSACVFCPFGPKPDWQTFAAELPIQFGLVEALEANKPPTKRNGIKLSIKGYSKRTRADGTVKITAPPIRKWVNGAPSTWRPKPCRACGSLEADRSDRVGCSYYRDPNSAAA